MSQVLHLWGVVIKGTDLIQGASLPEPSWWMFSLLRWVFDPPSLAGLGKGE